MPQWRKLHVKTLESLDINEMPDDFTRLLWVMLPLALDSAGRGIDNPSWIRSRVMPLRDDVPPDQIAGAFQWYHRRGMIVRYEVDNRPYFFIPTFEQYQGRTGREAPSRFPEPASGREKSAKLETNTGVGQEQVGTNSGAGPALDVDVDIDSDIDSKTLGANAPPAPRKRTKRQKMLAVLEETFSDISGLPPPKRKTASQKNSAATLWWNPLVEISELAGSDTNHAKNLMERALRKMLADDLTVASPKSILKTAQSITAKGRRNGKARSHSKPYTQPDEAQLARDRAIVARREARRTAKSAA